MSQYSTKVALLANSIDYAGMFPPASLSFEAALAKAATYRKSAQHPWLLAKVVLGMNELKQITPTLLFQNQADGSAWHFSALASQAPADPPSEFIKAFEWDLRELKRVRERGQGSSVPWSVDAYEVKLPPTIHRTGQGITAGEYIFPCLERVEDQWPSKLDVYFEIQLDQAPWAETLESTCQILAEWLSEFPDSPVTPGLKIRTGGKYVPSVNQMAEVIDTGSSYGLRLKFTQGLHHPLTKGKDLGFVNLFGAIALAYSLDENELTQDELEALISDESAAGFSFAEEEFIWRDKKLTRAQMEKSRLVHATTFGSCSLDEPDLFLAKEFP